MLPLKPNNAILIFTVGASIIISLLTGCSHRYSNRSLVYWVSDVDQEGNRELVIGNRGAEDVRIDVVPLLRDLNGEIRYLYAVDVLNHETSILLRGTKFTNSAQSSRFRDDQEHLIQLPHYRNIDIESLSVQIKTIAVPARMESVDPVRIQR